MAHAYVGSKPTPSISAFCIVRVLSWGYTQCISSRAGVAQLARALAFQAKGRGFESRLPLHFLILENGKRMDTVDYSNVKRTLSKIMDDVCKSNDVKIITRRNRPSVVIISLEDYNSITETHYLLSSPANATKLERAIKELNNGKGIKAKLIRK